MNLPQFVSQVEPSRAFASVLIRLVVFARGMAALDFSGKALTDDDADAVASSVRAALRTLSRSTGGGAGHGTTTTSAASSSAGPASQHGHVLQLSSNSLGPKGTRVAFPRVHQPIMSCL